MIEVGETEGGPRQRPNRGRRRFGANAGARSASTAPGPGARSRRHPTGRPVLGPRLVMATFVLGGLVLLGAVRLAAIRHDLVEGRDALNAAREAVMGRRDELAQRSLSSAEARLESARRRSAEFPLGLIRPVPLLGSPARAAAGTAKAGLKAVRAARIVATATKRFPAGGEASVHGQRLTAFHDAAVASGQALAKARIHLRAARLTMDGPAGALIPQISRPARSLRDEIDAMTGALDRARDGLALAAELTAGDSDARLLLLNQDSLELRPTGGYIGSYGVLRFLSGTVSLEKFEATESLPAAQPPLPPPPDLAPALPRGWRLSNANWWPDFPTSARAARELFRRQGGGEVDGVVAITERLSARLIGAVGPLSLPSYEKPVVEAGFAERAVYEVELKRPLDQPRKKFLIELGEVLFDRLFDIPAERVPRVADAMEDAAASGDLQLWFADTARQRRIAPTVLGGRLPRTDGDFLMLVDANLSASKANIGVVKDVTYRVRRQGQRLRALVQVRVRNRVPQSQINPSYNSYLRLYVPLGARRLGGKPLGERAEDGPYRVFTESVDVQPLQERVVTFEYLLPPSVAPEGRYSLVWVRQPGTPGDSLDAEFAGEGHFELPGDRRSLRVTASFRDSAVIEFLRTRWIVRRLDLLD